MDDSKLHCSVTDASRLGWGDLASLKFRYFHRLAFSSHMSLAISLVVLQEVTDVLIHLGAHPGVGMWHLQCLAHWGGLAEQDYNPSGPMVCFTRLCETQLKSAWPSYLVDDQAFNCFFQCYALIQETLCGSAECLTSSQPTWAADGAVPSWGYLGGERCCGEPQESVPYQEPILKRPSRKHTSICSLLM